MRSSRRSTGWILHKRTHRAICPIERGFEQAPAPVIEQGLVRQRALDERIQGHTMHAFAFPVPGAGAMLQRRPAGGVLLLAKRFGAGIRAVKT